jgi:shikimate kinase
VNIVLTGFMGTGKTAVGKIIAEKLGWPFFDTDAMIEKETGLTVAQIFAKRGEAPFRDLETQTVRLVGLLDECVIATGGGVPLRPENMAELERNGFVVCLTAAPETVVKRVREEGRARPLLSGKKEPLETVRELLDGRRTAYARCKAAVATDGRTPEDIASAVLRLARPA